MSEEKEAPPSEDSIRVICRFRPLNHTEEKTGSKFIVKFPAGTDDQCVSIGVGYYLIFKCIIPIYSFLGNRVCFKNRLTRANHA